MQIYSNIHLHAPPTHSRTSLIIIELLCLIKLAIRWLIKQLKGHKLDHALGSEILHIVRVLRLFLYQSEHGTIQQRVERVVVELAHGHLSQV